MVLVICCAIDWVRVLESILASEWGLF